jgi:hypothetical protein
MNPVHVLQLKTVAHRNLEPIEQYHNFCDECKKHENGLVPEKGLT